MKPKKDLHRKWKSFNPQIQVKTEKTALNIIQRSDAHQNQIIGVDADIDHSQIIGGDISPRVLAPLGTSLVIMR